MKHTRVHAMEVPPEQIAGALLALRSDPLIEFAELDGLAHTAYVPNDPIIYARQAWHLDKIAAQRAWDFSTGSNAIVVAVLDTGVAGDHPDLIGRVIPGQDFVNGDSDPSDDYGHGTAVAGVVVASGNNRLGSAGVAYSCSVLAVKVADSSGFAAYSDIAEGVVHAVDCGARIINISVAGTLPSATLQEAVDYARSRGALVIAASGNNGNATPLYPASCAGVVSVGATTADDLRASFSNYGATLQLTAPGDGIWTTQNDPARPYAAWRGTSFAAPVVCGAAALALSIAPSMPLQDLETLLRLSVDDLGSAGWDPQFGYGRVNAAKLVSTLLNVPLSVGPESEPMPEIVDSEAPLISIRSGPAHRGRTEQENITFLGNAKDNIQLARIEALVDGQTFQAEGTTNWMVVVPLTPGTNWIAFRACDQAGNRSREIKRAIFRSVKSVLSIQCTGDGRIVPDLNGVELEIGRSYTVRAMPGPGNILETWGNGPVGAPVLRFIMSAGLGLRPIFSTNHFPAVTGAYSGLVAGQEAVTPQNSGYFVLNVTRSGQYSGALLMSGRRMPFSGRFLSDGSARALMRRKGLPTLAADFQVDFNYGCVSGTMSDGAWVSKMSASRNVFNAITNPAPQAGQQGFALKAAQRSEAPDVGSGQGTIARTGAALVKGGLSDGRRFARRSNLNPTGDYPFYLSFNKGSEILIGWVNFPAEVNSGASGQVLWVANGTNSFATSLKVAGL